MEDLATTLLADSKSKTEIKEKLRKGCKFTYLGKYDIIYL